MAGDAQASGELISAEEARRLRLSGTPGPWWYVKLRDADGDMYRACIMSKHVAVTDGCAEGELSVRDAALACRAPDAMLTIEALDAENARLRAEVARLQALLAASPLRVAPSEHDGSAA